ncbi:Hpt domain-containing protein [Nemorincola caseinilytica]
MGSGKQYIYIDTEHINELTDGDTELIVQILTAAVNTLPDDLQKLTTAINTGNTEHTRFYAHKLKGSFYFIGGRRLGDAFATIERYSTDGASLHLIPAIFWPLLRDARKAQDELKELLKDMDTAS